MEQTVNYWQGKLADLRLHGDFLIGYVDTHDKLSSVFHCRNFYFCRCFIQRVLVFTNRIFTNPINATNVDPRNAPTIDYIHTPKQLNLAAINVPNTASINKSNVASIDEHIITPLHEPNCTLTKNSKFFSVYINTFVYSSSPLIQAQKVLFNFLMFGQMQQE